MARHYNYPDFRAPGLIIPSWSPLFLNNSLSMTSIRKSVEPALSHGIILTEIAADLFQNDSELNISILRSIKWLKMSAHIDPSGSLSSFNYSQYISI
jgi:hypothetical protein